MRSLSSQPVLAKWVRLTVQPKTGPKSQKVFLNCLTTEHRKNCLELRADKKNRKALEDFFRMAAAAADTPVTATKYGGRSGCEKQPSGQHPERRNKR